MDRRRWKQVLAGLGATALSIQLVPYGRAHADPPVVKEPAWDSPQTQKLARTACYDCHSNETIWPWYSWIAPASWLVQYHVDDARRHMNFSRWDQPQRHAKHAAKAVREGEMPPGYYRMLHAKADLTPEQRAALVKGLEATLGAAPAPGAGGS